MIKTNIHLFMKFFKGYFNKNLSKEKIKDL